MLAEMVGQLGLADSEVVRKIVHIGIGNVILLAWWLQIPAWLGVSASLLFSGVTLLSYWLPILPGINSVGRQSLGTFFYTLSFASLIGLFWSSLPHFAVLGILVMAWGDGLAALIGQTWGRHPYQIWGMKKSWEGTAAMFLISFMVAGTVLSALPTQEPIWVVAGLVAIAATILESCSKFGVDNLTVPLGSGAIAFLLSQLFLA
nr:MULTISPECIES: diacylglycerol/polyprenol kinase family protein [unclassified Leptolyngbya]